MSADDYGLTAGVSRAILDAHHRGLVTSTSVLVIGPAFAQTSPWLQDAPELDVGLHLAITGEDPPLLTRREIATLVNRQGRLAQSWRALLPRLMAGRVDVDDVRREFDAQHERATAAGLRVTHLDAHQHIHLWPMVGEVLVSLAARNGILATRVPGSSRSSPIDRVFNRLGRRFSEQARSANIGFAPTFAGFEDRGHLTAAKMVRALARARERSDGAVELGVHPGEAGDPDLHRYRWGYEWSEEHRALVSPVVRAGVRRLGFRLGRHADLPV